MALMRLALLGLVGGGAAYLYKNPKARETALTFARDLMETGREMVPPKYQEMASRFGLGSQGSTYERMTNMGLDVPEEDAGNRPGGPIEPAHS